MEVFTFSPHSTESLADFNSRIADFCLESEENPVVGVVSSLAGRTLVVSLSQMEDLPFVPPMAVLVVATMVEPTDAGGMENKLTEVLETIKAMNTDDTPRIPVEVRMHTDNDGYGYALILINVGAIEESGDAE